MGDSAGVTSGGARRRVGHLSLGAKLIFLSTLLTVVVVSVAFLALSVALRRHTRASVAQTLAEHGQTLSHLQRAGSDELLRISTLLADSPTLRAAMETFQGESNPTSRVRVDLLATIQTEAQKVAKGLGRDLLLVTGTNGRVLASSGWAGQRRWVGKDLSASPVIRRVLDQDGPVGASSFGVLTLDGKDVRVGCAPILLQGYIIGTLTLGDRIDRTFASRLQQSFGCELVVAAGSRVVTSTLERDLSPAELQALDATPRAGTAAPRVADLGSEEYVAAMVPLGADAGGQEIRLYLLQSLTKSLADSNRSLLAIVLSCGLLAVLAAWLAARSVSRSLLRPLEEFVGFMRSVAESGDHTRRFVGHVSCVEVETLSEAYHQLMESLLAHERRLLDAARDDLERLERLKESEKLAALGRMLSGAAHEINNPLTGVLGNLEMILRSESLPPEARERLEKVKREGRRVAALVKHLLKISHRDTGETSTVEVNGLLRDAVETRRHDFVASGLRLDLEPSAEPAAVLGNELELHQVFLNIINNAFDALSEAKSGGGLTVRTRVESGRVHVELTDDGPGMKNPKLVFDHFYTTKPVGRGTGLGLSICYAIVERHGGRITPENVPGRGARFTVELPAAPRTARPVSAPDLSESLAELPFDASVLVVDDEPTLVDLQREILETLGAQVVSAASGREAIELLRHRTFDLIVTDVKMPGGVSGEDLFRWVESNAPDATRRIVFVTGDMAGDGSRAFVDVVGARCVMKPFTMEDYVRTLRDTIAEGRRGR